MAKVGTSRKHQRTYTNEEKKRAAYEYVACGSANKVSKIVGMPRKTLDNWIEGDEDFHLFHELAISARNQVFAGRCSGLFMKAMEGLEDRLDNGDPIVIRGEVTGRAPVKASDLNYIAQGMFDKNRIGNAQPARYGEGSKGLEETLRKTQETLEKFAGKTDTGKNTSATILKIVEKQGAK